MNATDNLAALMAHIVEKWPYDERNYPELRNTPPECVYRFGVRHSVLHIVKTALKIITRAEGADHGVKIDEAALRVDLSKGLANILRLAAHIGMSADDLVHGVQDI